MLKTVLGGWHTLDFPSMRVPLKQPHRFKGGTLQNSATRTSAQGQTAHSKSVSIRPNLPTITSKFPMLEPCPTIHTHARLRLAPQP